MTELREIYKCQVCTNVVEVIGAGGPSPFCCGKEMVRLEAKTEDTGNEKHVPLVNEVDGGIEVVVGEIEHPMEEKHYVQFIEVLTQDKVLREELKPGQRPAACFNLSLSDVQEVREYCNIHGLWKA